MIQNRAEQLAETTQQSRTISLNQKIARLHTRPAAYTNQEMLNSH